MYNIMTTLLSSGWLSGLSFRDILEYYAILCLCLMPVDLMVMIYLARKTDYLERLDRYIDKLISKAPAEEKKEEGKKGEKAEDKKDEGPQQTPDENDELERAGVSIFCLPVGEEYVCRLSSQNRMELLYGTEWFSSNKFIGDIEVVDDEYVFRARKAGSAIVSHRQLNHLEDPGAQAYKIIVIPMVEYPMLDTLLDRLQKGVVLAGLNEEIAGRKINASIPEKNLYFFGAGREDRGLTLQFGSGGALERFVIALNCEEIDDIIKEALTERFTRIVRKDEPKDESLWVHKYIPEQAEEDEAEIDVYCFLKRTLAFGWVLAVGRMWREYGQQAEFLLNISMAERMFYDCLPDEKPSFRRIDVPRGMMASVLRPKSKKEVVITPAATPEPLPAPAEETVSPETIGKEPETAEVVEEAVAAVTEPEEEAAETVVEESVPVDEVDEMEDLDEDEIPDSEKTDLDQFDDFDDSSIGE